MAQKTDDSQIISDIWTVFTPFCGVKNGQGSQKFIPNWLQIGSEKTSRKGQEIYFNCLEADFNVHSLAYLIKLKVCWNCPLFTHSTIIYKSKIEKHNISLDIFVSSDTSTSAVQLARNLHLPGEITFQLHKDRYSFLWIRFQYLCCSSFRG